MLTHQEEGVGVASGKSTATPKSPTRKTKYDNLAEDEHEEPTSNRGLAISRDVPVRALKELDDCSRFLDLPAELRDMIYRFALTPFECQWYVSGIGHEWTYEPFRHPPLTRVSSQVRLESLAVFFGCNTFDFKSVLPVNTKEKCFYNHMLDPASWRTLVHPSWSAHVDFVRFVNIGMEVVFEPDSSRMVQGLSDVPHDSFPLRVTFKRDIKAVPQYSVCVKVLVRSFTESARNSEDPRLLKLFQDLARDEEAVAAYINKQAQAVLDDIQSSFTFSKQGLWAFVDRIPHTLKW